MSTKLHDIPNNAQINAALTPRVITTTTSSNSQDFQAGDGRCCAIQQIGAVTGTSPSLAGKIQESSDGTNWTDISGATFTAVTTADNVQSISFDRTKRYLRYVATLTGTSPNFQIAALIVEQKKQV